MSDQQILPCVMCGQQHQQMLMLVCMHDPCINCAAIHYCNTQVANSNEFVCSKCSEVTQLDTSSVVELQRVYSQLKGKKRYDYRKGQGSITEGVDIKSNANSNRTTYKNKLQTQPKQNNISTTVQNPSYSNHHSYTPISQPSYPSNPYNNIQLKKSNQPFYMCQTHPQQQLSYFCFNCNGPICPQCAIHGTHREHEVQTTRKAIKTIKESLKKSHEGLGSEINNLSTISDSYKNRLKQIGSEVKKQKEIVRDSFNQLRLVLAEKQKQFNRSIQNCSDNNSSIIKSEAQTFDKLIQQHSNVRKNIDSTFKKDELSILQQFSKRQKQANSMLQGSKNRRYNHELQGLKQIDFGLFRDQIDQLNGIMSALKLTMQPKRRN